MQSFLCFCVSVLVHFVACSDSWTGGLCKRGIANAMKTLAMCVCLLYGLFCDVLSCRVKQCTQVESCCLADMLNVGVVVREPVPLL